MIAMSDDSETPRDESVSRSYYDEDLEEQKSQKSQRRKIADDTKNYEFVLLHHFAMAKDVGTLQHDIDMAEFLFSYVGKRNPLEIRYRNLCIMMGLERKPFKSIDMSDDYSAKIPDNMIIIKEYIDKKQTICDLQAEIDKLIANYDADRRTVAE